MAPSRSVAWVLSLLVLAPVSDVASAGTWVGGTNGPRIHASTPEYDFGTNDSDRTVEHVYLIGNIGNQPLDIGTIRGCCGATTAIGTQRLLPGSNTDFRIDMPLQGRSGRLQKSFYIGSNDPGQPYLQLRLTGEVRPLVEVQPARVDFGKMEPSGKVAQEATVFSRAGEPFTITNVVATPACIAARWLNGTNRLARRIEIKVKPPMPEGVRGGEVAVLTDNPRFPKVMVPVAWDTESDMVVVPAEIRAGEPPDAGWATSRFIRLRARSGKGFKVVSVDPPDPSIQCAVTSPSTNVWQVELLPARLGADISGETLAIRTDLPGAEDVRVRFR